MSKENIRKITRISKYSYGITLPKRVLKNFGWKERQRVTLKISNRKQSILIEDYKTIKRSR